MNRYSKKKKRIISKDNQLKIMWSKSDRKLVNTSLKLSLWTRNDFITLDNIRLTYEQLFPFLWNHKQIFNVE